jgi:hypothetical protein
LDADERDAVRGDFAESGETGAQALREVLGLALRRQAGLWKGWQPWVVLVGLVAPFGLLLSLVSRRVADGSVIYAWMYFNNWDWALLGHRAFWIILAQTSAPAFPDTVAVICLSWTIGLMLGALSRRAIPVTGALFFLVLLFGEFVAIPQYKALQLQFLNGLFGRHFKNNDIVYSLTFYKVMFPLLVQVVLVLLPSLWGMYKGLRMAALPILLRTILWAPAIAIMAALATTQGVWWAAMATHNWAWLQRGWQLPLLRFAVVGPVLYWASTAGWQRWNMAKPHRPLVL